MAAQNAAQRDIVVSGRLHDSPDRVHNDVRLIDGHNMTRLSSNDHASSL
jgi:hypothetical protein